MSTEEVNTNQEHNAEEHVHGENCQHDEEVKGGKSEKKVRKALGKLGMTKVENVNRVTVRQKDNYVLVVKDPEVYTSQQAENTFIIFGELTFEDPDKKLAKEEIEKMRAEGEKVRPETTTETKEAVEIIEEEEGEDSGEGLDAENIETVMSESKCTRQRAIKALRSVGGMDVVSAVLSISN
jgi:nascent polypeptide-associated complex subunit alpha